MSITLSTLLIGVAIAAAVFFLIQYFAIKKPDNALMSYMQAFVGILFLFSGWVKAIDPLGTAYKMDQYFAEFETAFETSWMSFLAPLFPVLNEYSVAFSVVMIVFEIVLGLMILLGIYKKFATWAFFLLILVFTFLTGFTYLTGYVGGDATFFNFASWGSYKESNMKVTDCGCFGDFLKLEPMVSFFKDIFLLIPGILFIIFRKKMHTLIDGKKALWISVISTVLVTIYCFSNYVWDLPHTDFRPFREGVDIQKQKQIEEDAQAAVQVTGFLMKNKKDPNRMTEVTMAEYSAYSDEWEVVEQIRTEPTLEPSKISEFDLNDVNGDEATYEILEGEGKSIMIVAYKLKGKASTNIKTIVDTITILDEASGEMLQKFVSKEIKEVDFISKPKYAELYVNKVSPFAEEALKAGYKVNFLVGGASGEEAQDFVNDVGLNATIFTGDDILMKTIIRSNPGVLILDNAKIQQKFHIRKLPSFTKMNK